MTRSMSARPAYERLLDEARERFDAAEDFTVSVEEEFALLDPESLDLVNRFEDVQAAAQGTVARAEPRRRADRLRGRGQDGRSSSRSPTSRPRSPSGARELSGARRAARAARWARPGTHPWAQLAATSGSSTRRTTGGTTSSSGTSSGATTPSASTPTSRSAAPTARCAVDLGAAQLAAGAPRRVGELAVPRGRRHGAPLGADAGLHALLPALRRAGRVRRPGTTTRAYVRFLYETGSIDEHTQLWWSVRPHLAFPTVELRICDGQPDVGEAQALAALMTSVTARCARALDEGEPLPSIRIA